MNLFQESRKIFGLKILESSNGNNNDGGILLFYYDYDHHLQRSI